MTAPGTAPRSPTLLIILDGVGINPGKINNPLAEAHTPTLDSLYAHYPHTFLHASGIAVGLPDGQMGNSEVGHLTLGCGSVIRQASVAIDDAIADGSFFSNPALVAAVKTAVERNRPVHLVGLVSDGGVHSHLHHLSNLVKLCKQRGAVPLLHMITDGRDTPPRSALDYLRSIEPDLHEAGGAIATIMGRFYAMDRDHRWERTELAWRALMLGRGQKAQSAETAIRSAYAAGDNDEFIQPVLLPSARNIAADDQVICFNFRKDRPRQLVAALAKESFHGFDRGDVGQPAVTCLLRYDSHFEMPFAFEPERPATTLAQQVSDAGLKQYHCAETEKYAHVTYFFNGGRDQPFPGETRHLVPSPNVSTYDRSPEMSAAKVSDAVIAALNSRKYAFTVVNYANGDMVGHTARADAVIHAIECLDSQLNRVINSARENGYAIIVTADHGNCEELVAPGTGQPHTQHTTYPVPFIVIDREIWQLSCAGSLANVAPTVLQLMGLSQPASMTGKSLLLKSLGKADLESPVQGAA